MALFDFHSHILPGIDDGSASVEESLALLEESKRQGVDGLAATPHFYVEQMAPEQFLKKRQLAYEKLKLHQKGEWPSILLGAEVPYYDGISRSEEILKLRLEGTKVLLIEMPYRPWTQRICEELFILNSRKEVIVLLAHIERYLSFQKTETLAQMRQQNILFQANGSFFLKRQTRKKACKMLQNGLIDVLGSDCHNGKDRRPNLKEAQSVIIQMLGQNGLERLFAQEKRLFKP